MTFFIDFDGCIYPHLNDGGGAQHASYDLEPLHGAKDTLDMLEKAGHRIIIVTGRPNWCHRGIESWLMRHRLAFHLIICGCTGGTRCLVNDEKPEPEPPSCISVMVPRNQGISSLKKFGYYDE
jgi:phosphoglycolate phosphatase-like HAD superfamily hydrolase